MHPTAIYNHSDRITQLDLGGTIRCIAPRGCWAGIDTNLVPHILERAAAEGLPWSTEPIKHIRADQAAQVALESIAQLGLIPVSMIPEPELRTLRGATLRAIATHLALPFTAEATTKQLASLIFAAGSSTGRTPDHSSGETGSTPVPATISATPEGSPSSGPTLTAPATAPEPSTVAVNPTEAPE